MIYYIHVNQNQLESQTWYISIAGPGRVESVDNVDTQPVDLDAISPPEPTPAKPQSFDDSYTRRCKFQGVPKNMMKTKPVTPSTTASTHSERDLDQKLLDVAEGELDNQVLVRKTINSSFNGYMVSSKNIWNVMLGPLHDSYNTFPCCPARSLMLPGEVSSR